MILKNNQQIYKMYKGGQEITKFDKDGYNAFTEVVDSYVPPTCPTVTESISTYQGTDPEVYATDTQKWYERNNLGQYEEYGIYQTVNDLSTTTTYVGKLVYYNNNQYEWNGSSWVDLGSAGTMVTIQSPSYIYNDSSHLFSIPVGYTASTDSKFSMRIKPLENGGGAIIGDNDGTSDRDDYRVFLYDYHLYFDAPGSSTNGNRIYGGSFLNQDANVEFGNFYIKNLNTGTNVVTGTPFTYQRQSTMRLGESNQYGHISTDKFQLSALTMYHGDNLSRDFIPAIDGNDICLFDKVSGQYHKSDNGKMPLSGGTINEVQVGTLTPIHTYAEKEQIATSVTVSDLSEVDCPFDGLVAYVNGTRYTYTNGEWVETIDWSQEYLTFEAIESGEFKLKRNNSPVSCQYSLDNGTTWTTLANDTWSPTVSAGQKIKWKADISPIQSETVGAGGVGFFTATGRFNAMGNPYSLLWSSGFENVTSLAGKAYALNQLFYANNKVVSCENLTFPAMTLSEKCYRNMFGGGCTSLTTPPSVLPSMSLTTYCYVGMFNGCTALTKSPYLPATSLYTYCYQSMFINCTSLTEIRAMFTTSPSSSYMNNWVQGVPSGGTFYKNANASWSNTFGNSAIPTGWTVVTEQPQS